MSDYNSALPVRTEADADERLQSKIVDYTVPTQGLVVNVDGSVNVTDNGGSLTVDGSVTVTATDLDIRDLSAAQDNVAISDGTDTLAVNADGSINAVVSATDLDIRNLSHTQDSVKVGDGTDFLAIAADGSIAVTDNGGSLTVDAVNLDIRDLTAASDSVKAWVVDEAGNPFTGANPLPVYLTEDPGSEVCVYNTSASLAANASSNHNYSVANGAVFELWQVEASGSGKMKIEVQVGDGGIVEVFASKAVLFNSTATPDMSLRLVKPIKVTGTVNTTTVRVIRTNKDNQAQDVYSTIVGLTQ